MATNSNPYGYSNPTSWKPTNMQNRSGGTNSTSGPLTPPQQWRPTTTPGGYGTPPGQYSMSSGQPVNDPLLGGWGSQPQLPNGAQGPVQPQSQQQSSGQGGGGGGNGQTSPNPSPYEQPWVDYINADGTPHNNPQYGNQGSNIGQGGGGSGQTSGEGDPAWSSWGTPSYYNPANGAPQLGYGFDWNSYQGAPDEKAARANEYAQIYLPQQQLQQNAYQHYNDSNRAGQQWQQEFGANQANTQWQQNFSNRQQTQAEIAQTLANNQWYADQNRNLANDKYTQGANDRTMTHNEQQAGIQNQMQQQGIDITRLTQQQKYEIERGTLSLAQVAQQQKNTLDTGYLGLANTAQDDTRRLNEWNTNLAQNKLNQEGSQYNRTQTYNEQMGAFANKMQQGGLDLANLTQQQKYMIDTGQLSLAQLKQSQDYGLGQGNLALQNRAQTENNALGQWGARNQQTQIGNDFTLGKGQLDLAKLSQSDLNKLQTGELTLNQLKQRQEYELASRGLSQEAALTREGRTQQYGYEYAALNQAAQQEASRLGLSLQEFQQTASYQNAQSQLAQQKLQQEGSLAGRGYDIQERQTQQEMQLARERMVQEAALERERLATQRQSNSYGAFGRAFQPNARWLRAGQ